MKSKPTTCGLFLSVFLLMTGVGMIVAVLPRTYVALSGSPHSVGSLAAAFAVTYLLVQLAVGRLADRFAFRPWLVAGYFVCALSGFCFFTGTNALALILGRLIQGLGEAPAWSLAPAILARECPRRPGRLIGGYSAVIHVGLACGPFLGILIRVFWPERSVFALFGVLCLLGGVIVAGTLKTPGRLPGPADRMSLLENPMAMLAADRSIMAVLPAVALYGAGYGACLTVLPVYLGAVKGLGEIGLGFYFSGFYTTIGLAAIVAGVMSDRFGRRRFMLAGLILGGFGTAFLPALDGVSLAVLLIASVLALGIFGLSAFAYLNDRMPADFKGTLSGVYFLSWGFGMFVGPLIIGWMDAAAGAGGGIQSYGVTVGLYGLLFAGTLPETMRTGRN